MSEIRCPECGTARGSQVTDSRAGKDGEFIRRRRMCNVCQQRWTTVEVAVTDKMSQSRTEPQAVVNDLEAAFDLVIELDSAIANALARMQGFSAKGGRIEIAKARLERLLESDTVIVGVK